MIETVLAACGATICITHTKIGKPLRKLGPLFRCPACLGFWIGLAAYILEPAIPATIAKPLKAALTTSFIAYTLSAFASWADLHFATVNVRHLPSDPPETLTDHGPHI